MQKTKNFESLIIKVLASFIEEYNLKSNSVKPHLIIDKKTKHYMLFLIGWDGDRFVHTILFHYHIHDGKILQYHNGTEIPLIDKLINLGVAKKDIILGNRPKYANEYAGFGVA